MTSLLDTHSQTLLDLAGQSFISRLWDKDPTVWRQGSDGAKVIANRLGWLTVTEIMRDRVPEIVEFADEVKTGGFCDAVLLGMGGSSLSPEVSRLTFGPRRGYPGLSVLDSTVPEAVLSVERKIDPAKTIFVVAMKSGATVETNSCYRYFYEKVKTAVGKQAGKSFVAITDPGTSLEAEAKSKGFRRLFLNPPDIGGRYSALSYFGLVPAAVIGVNVARLLSRASAMVTACSRNAPLTDNPAIALGMFMAENALAGRDKLGLIMSPEIVSLGYWIEQLVAESTGKSGTGVLPVEGQILCRPRDLGADRCFVYTRLASGSNEQTDLQATALKKARFPVLKIEVNDVYDLGGEYFRWEMATAVASALLGVNPFDEPNVKESKDNTKRLLTAFDRRGRLPETRPVISEDDISLHCSREIRAALDVILAGKGEAKSVGSYLHAFLALSHPGDYAALMAFLYPSQTVAEKLGSIRDRLSKSLRAAVTLGYGPRFLHSTGQFHKGGPNNGLFIQFTADDSEDVAIPGVSYTFGTLKQAQSLGDALSLQSRGRPFLRIHLGANAQAGLAKILKLL